MSEPAIKLTAQQMTLLAEFVTSYFDETMETLEYGLYAGVEEERSLKAIGRCLMEYAQSVDSDTLIAPKHQRKSLLIPKACESEPPMEYVWARLTPEQAKERPLLYCEDCENGDCDCIEVKRRRKEPAMDIAVMAPQGGSLIHLNLKQGQSPPEEFGRDGDCLIDQYDRVWVKSTKKISSDSAWRTEDCK